jgi:hypothetical protein
MSNSGYLLIISPETLIKISDVGELSEIITTVFLVTV